MPIKTSIKTSKLERQMEESIERFSADEMDKAVGQFVLSFDIHPSQVARELGISEQELFNWQKTIAKKKIRYWSIEQVFPPKEEMRPGVFVCSHGISDPTVTEYIIRTVYLRRPGQKPCVAVVNRKIDGTLVLNARRSTVSLYCLDNVMTTCYCWFVSRGFQSWQSERRTPRKQKSST